jgi:hypothetical protein
MNPRLLVVLAVGVPFVIFSLWVTWEHGFVTIFSDALTKPTHLQVFLDLCIACFVCGGWMLADGRRKGITAWPFVVLLPLIGSIATLGYLVVRESRR